MAAPYEPRGDNRSLAQNNWDIYQSHIQAGFTPEQAMQFICTMFYSAAISNAINPNQFDD